MAAIFFNNLASESNCKAGALNPLHFGFFSASLDEVRSGQKTQHTYASSF